MDDSQLNPHLMSSDDEENDIVDGNACSSGNGSEEKTRLDSTSSNRFEHLGDRQSLVAGVIRELDRFDSHLRALFARARQKYIKLATKQRDSSKHKPDEIMLKNDYQTHETSKVGVKSNEQTAQKSNKKKTHNNRSDQSGSSPLLYTLL